MNLSIRGGTAKFGEPSLCESCKFAFIVEGDNKQIRMCHTSPSRVKINFRVSRCIDYLERSKSSLYDMKQMAWILDLNKKGGKIGFVKPRDLTQDQKDELQRIED